MTPLPGAGPRRASTKRLSKPARNDVTHESEEPVFDLIGDGLWFSDKVMRKKD
jgi:hypothetical protein